MGNYISGSETYIMFFNDGSIDLHRKFYPNEWESWELCKSLRQAKIKLKDLKIKYPNTQFELRF